MAALEKKAPEDIQIDLTITDSATPPVAINIANLTQLKVYLKSISRDTVVAQYARDTEAGFDDTHLEVTDGPNGEFTIYVLESIWANEEEDTVIAIQIEIEETNIKFTDDGEKTTKYPETGIFYLTKDITA